MESSKTADESDFDPRAYGWIIVVGSIAALGGMSLHPTGGGDAMEMVRNLVENGGFNALIHGILMGLYLLLILGFVGFTDWLGARRLLVRAGLIAYAAGAFAGIAAGIAAGFMFRTIAFGYVGAETDELNSVTSAFRVTGALNYAWGRMWMIAISAAILLWSIELVRRQGLARPTGYLGLLVGVAGFAGIPSGLIPLSVFAMVGLVAGQTVWSVGAGALMIRQPRP